MPDTSDKCNDTLNTRLPDTLKTRFNRIAEAKGTSMSAIVLAYIEGFVEEEEQYIASIADMFGYTKTRFKEKRVSHLRNNVSGGDTHDG